ncbi:unnamed protein product [Caenorhabditis angaria]|uniref:C2H2-type domain-containing protein n=1 Tax=Caenorhabditis angaria TaxID=860376 RepID=A0A9P1N420_9PELO|nr:unnamed protein product [Caenorhabditis angaria]
MRVCAKSAVCGIRKCKRRFSDQQTFQAHVNNDHNPISFPESTDWPATKCTWRHCNLRYHLSKNYFTHFNVDHLKLMNIRIRPDPRKIKKPKRNMQCENCHRKFASRNMILLHHLRCHKDKRPVDQDEHWPEIQKFEAEPDQEK